MIWHLRFCGVGFGGIMALSGLVMIPEVPFIMLFLSSFLDFHHLCFRHHWRLRWLLPLWRQLFSFRQEAGQRPVRLPVQVLFCSSTTGGGLRVKHGLSAGFTGVNAACWPHPGVRWRFLLVLMVAWKGNKPALIGTLVCFRAGVSGSVGLKNLVTRV